MSGLLTSRHGRGVALRPPSRGRFLGIVAALCAAVVLVVLLLTALSSSPSGGAAAPGVTHPTKLHSRTTSVTPNTVAQDGAASMRYVAWKAPPADAGLMMPAVGPDGRVWVGEMTANKLAALRAETNGAGSYDEFAYGGDHPTGTMGAVVDTSGRLWLAQEEVNALGELGTRTGVYRQLPVPTPSAQPSGIALDSQGRVWFTELGAHAIGAYDPAADKFSEYPIGDAGFYPYWLSVAQDGRIWFTNINGGTIGVLNPADGRVQTFAVPGARATTGIAVAADGTVWFGVQEGALGRLRSGDQQPTLLPLPSGGGYGVAVDPHGEVWIGTNAAVVYEFDPGSGQFQADITGAGAWWVAVAGDGTIWVAEGSAEGNALGHITHGN